MDQFKKLQEKIKNIIERINRQLEEKQQKLVTFQELMEEVTEEEETLTQNIKSLREKKETLSEIEKKGLLGYLVVKDIHGIKEEIEELKANHRWILLFIFALEAVGVSAVVVMALLRDPLLDFTIFAALGLYWLATKIPEIKKDLALKKDYTIVGIEKTIDENRKSIIEKRKQKRRFESKGALIEVEITELEKEREDYEKMLRDVGEYREQAITIYATPTLDEAFKFYDMSAINRRIREKRKKEIDNGKIV